MVYFYVPLITTILLAHSGTTSRHHLIAPVNTLILRLAAAVLCASAPACRQSRSLSWTWSFPSNIKLLMRYQNLFFSIDSFDNPVCATWPQLWLYRCNDDDPPLAIGLGIGSIAQREIQMPFVSLFNCLEDPNIFERRIFKKKTKDEHCNTELPRPTYSEVTDFVRGVGFGWAYEPTNCVHCSESNRIPIAR